MLQLNQNSDLNSVPFIVAALIRDKKTLIKISFDINPA